MFNPAVSGDSIHESHDNGAEADALVAATRAVERSLERQAGFDADRMEQARQRLRGGPQRRAAARDEPDRGA